MATVEFLQKRIEGKEKELAKAQKKMERILKAKESNWEKNPYYYHEEDIKWTQRDIDYATAELERYKAELETAQQKANSRDVAVIIEFLESWKQKFRDYIYPMSEKYYASKKEVRELYNKYCDLKWDGTEEEAKAKAEYEEKSKRLDERMNGYFMETEYTTRNYKGETVTRTKVEKVRDGEWEDLKHFDITYAKPDEFKAKVEKYVKVEADRKYDFIIERTNKIVGQITDASGLHIDPRGDLNGIIIGTNGKAKVTTIGAGGYNIQCFHFRVLIKPVKERR